MSSNVHALERVRSLHAKCERPERADVEAAFRTIIQWAGDDPERDGLTETPARVARAFEEFFVGYAQDPVEILKKTFEEIEGYDEMIVLRGIRFESHWPPLSVKRGWPMCRAAVSSALASSPAWLRSMQSAYKFRKR